MHKVAEVNLVKLARPKVLFSIIDELKIPELDNTKTDPSENHQDYGATPPVITQPSPPQSPLEDASVAPAAPLPHPRVEAVNATLQAQEGDLPDVGLLGAKYMLYCVYQDWMHQNPGDHLDGGIAEDSKWKSRLKKLVCMPTQRYDILGL